MANHQPLLRSQDMNICEQAENVKKNVENGRKRTALQDQASSKSDELFMKSAAKRQRLDRALPVFDPRFNFDALQTKVREAYSEFAFDVFRYMKHEEDGYRTSNYVREGGFNAQHRARLVDWMIESNEYHGNKNETLYITIHIIDRFFAAHPETSPDRYQLVAVSALFLASKYEEYATLDFDELLEFSEGAHVKRDVLLMEMDLFRACGGKLGAPTSYSFLRRYARVTNTDIQTTTLARFYLELSLHYADFAIDESPSKMAAAALILAFRSKGMKNDWAPSLEYYSGHQISDIEALADRFAPKVMKFKKTFPKCKASISKYSDSTFFEVAKGAFSL